MKNIPQKIYITTIDCYTAERLVIGPDSGVSVITACSASASAVGIMEPAIKYGYERGMQDLPEMKQFWMSA